MLIDSPQFGWWAASNLADAYCAARYDRGRPPADLVSGGLPCICTNG